MCSDLQDILSARYKAVSIIWYLVVVWTLMGIHIQLCWATPNWASILVLLGPQVRSSLNRKHLLVSPHPHALGCYNPLSFPLPSVGTHCWQLVWKVWKKEGGKLWNFHQKKGLRKYPLSCSKAETGNQKRECPFVKGPRIKCFHSQTLIHHP